MAGSHRRAPKVAARLAAIGAAVAAVVVVVLVIVLVNVLHHPRSTGVAASPPTTTRTTPPPSPTPTPTPTPTHRAAPPKPRPSATPTPPPSATRIEVFNNSAVPGRASIAAARLRHDGYPVSRVATRRTYPARANIVYYDPGNAAEAAAARGVVARHLGITVAAPRPAAIPAVGGLVVVVTASYR